MDREATKEIKIGNKVIGGGNPVLIQSMTNTKTEDVSATVEQIQKLEGAGCDIIRCAVPDMEAHCAHIAAQQRDAGRHCSLSATKQQGQIRENKIYHHAQRLTGAHFYFLLQSSPMGQRTIPPLSGEQNPRALGFHGHSHQRIHAREIIPRTLSDKLKRDLCEVSFFISGDIIYVSNNVVSEKEDISVAETSSPHA